MQITDKVHGAYSKVFIQYEGSLQDLGSRIEEGLNIPNFRYENLEDEPYDLVGYSEVLGFEVELRSIRDSKKWPDYQYLLEATTTDSFQEVFKCQMFDISLWMARYISLSCEVTALAENIDKETGQTFYFNKTTLKRENRIIEATK
ncbi:hypothetical protein [uncultured Brevibacillus sp.]|uniref:hypothetical protein n=1 Tax=uncultured Brevibacillus sp. TaxID=169970 RepID=UPI0025952E39|nr:hypothetical protein [uncultured Brevibacillus sp.]